MKIIRKLIKYIFFATIISIVLLESKETNSVKEIDQRNMPINLDYIHIVPYYHSEGHKISHPVYREVLLTRNTSQPY